MRPADRDRVIEMTRDVWDGRDYLPRVFDRWVGEAGAAFQDMLLQGFRFPGRQAAEKQAFQARGRRTGDHRHGGYLSARKSVR